MVRAFPALVFSLVILASTPNLAAGDGMMVRRLSGKEWARNRERAMINEPDQKALVFFEKGREQLIISPSFEGAPAKFAWIIPVPSRPNVQVMDGAVFHELARLTMPRPPAGDGWRTKGAAGVASAPAVQVLERKVVGAYDVAVLAATDGGALMKWLQGNGYPMPDRAQSPVAEYIREKWTFVACRVRSPSTAAGLRSGTLAPLRLTFRTARPIYPMRVSAANPAPFRVLIYLVLPRSESGGDRGGGALNVSGPSTFGVRQGVRWRATLEMFDRGAYPALRKLAREALDVYVLQTALRPEDSNRDYVWRTRSSRTARSE